MKLIAATFINKRLLSTSRPGLFWISIYKWNRESGSLLILDWTQICLIASWCPRMFMFWSHLCFLSQVSEEGLMLAPGSCLHSVQCARASVFELPWKPIHPVCLLVVCSWRESKGDPATRNTPEGGQSPDLPLLYPQSWEITLSYCNSVHV